jgi:hypothetical protein
MYGLVNEQFDDLPAPVIGMMFGVALWAVSFEGWMPALGVQEATTENPKKWPLSIMAHLVYGASMGLAYDALDNVL